MNLTGENMTFITNRSLDETGKNEQWKQGCNHQQGTSAAKRCSIVYSLMKNNKNGENKYAGKGSVEVH